MKNYIKLALFAGGALFGSFGIKLLSSKDAKKAYVHVTAAGLRMKDTVMQSVTAVQENAADIMASAKELNEELAAKRQKKLTPPIWKMKKNDGYRGVAQTAPYFREGGTYERNHIA